MLLFYTKDKNLSTYSEIEHKYLGEIEINVGRDILGAKLSKRYSDLLDMYIEIASVSKPIEVGTMKVNRDTLKVCVWTGESWTPAT